MRSWPRMVIGPNQAGPNVMCPPIQLHSCPQAASAPANACLWATRRPSVCATPASGKTSWAYEGGERFQGTLLFHIAGSENVYDIRCPGAEFLEPVYKGLTNKIQLHTAVICRSKRQRPSGEGPASLEGPRRFAASLTYNSFCRSAVCIPGPNYLQSEASFPDPGICIW